MVYISIYPTGFFQQNFFVISKKAIEVNPLLQTKKWWLWHSSGPWHHIYIHLPCRILSTKFYVISKKAIEIKPRPQVTEGQLVATFLNNMMKLLNWWIVVILGFGDLKIYLVRNHGYLNKWHSTQMSITYSCFHFHGMLIWSPIIPSDSQII